MTLLHLTAGVAMIVCPQCARRVALVYAAGELRIGQHAMPRPSNDRWVEGAACPASGESVGRVESEQETKGAT